MKAGPLEEVSGKKGKQKFEPREPHWLAGLETQ